MAKEIKKPGKVEEPDLLPAMGLFTILIPMLLSMTAFSKLAIVEVNLPERSMMQMDDQTPPPPDEQPLLMSISLLVPVAVSSPMSTLRNFGCSAASPMASSLSMRLMTLKRQLAPVLHRSARTALKWTPKSTSTKSKRSNWI